MSFSLGFGLVRPKHPLVKHVSPLPNSSPSSMVCGIFVFSVSGSRVLRTPDTSVTAANVTAGALTSNASCNIRVSERNQSWVVHFIANVFAPERGISIRDDTIDISLTNRVTSGVKPPAKRANMLPSPIAVFRTTVGNRSTV